jgi:putative ABC transport system substrate-binding protein
METTLTRAAKEGFTLNKRATYASTAKYRWLLISGLVVLFITLSTPGLGHASPVNLLLLTPEMASADEQRLAPVVDGISSHQGVTIHRLALTRHITLQDVETFIGEKNIHALIAIGHQSYEIAKKIDNQIVVVWGGLSTIPDDHTGVVSLIAPEQFLIQLRTLAPKVERVFAVYARERNAVFIREAQAEANRQGIQLLATGVDDMRQGVQHFMQILSQAEKTSDALWLIDDSVPDRVILPEVLKTAWDKGFVVFSANPLHARRGALFTLTPDLKKMGYTLAEMCLKQLNERVTPAIEFLPVSNAVINSRTASHLKLGFTSSQFATIYYE